MSKFSLKRKTQSILLENEAGDEVACELREMTASQRDAYLQKLQTRMERSADGTPVGVSNFQGLQAELISSCLFRGGELVLSQEIQEWPAKLVTDLYKEAQVLNGLDKVGAEGVDPNA